MKKYREASSRTAGSTRIHIGTFRLRARVNAVKYDEAIADFEKAVELKPDYADAYFNLGRTYYLMHDEDKACENYKLAARYGRPNLEDYLKRCD